jgi:RsiW-degrading membrane proteinase PrsW (M82 family)/ribosomal protein S18 acetylase RimI-like enzyme
MNLIALAIAPGLAICLFIFHRDAYNREPKLNLLVTFVLGALSIIPAVFIETAMTMNDNTISAVAIQAFFVVALTEEVCKFSVLRFYSYPKKSFDEPLDGIVYGVMASMGFATVENILYVNKYASMGMGYQVAFMRMLLAVPAHATFGIVMGYFAGKAKFGSNNPVRLLLTGILAATILHGLYDFFLFLQGNPYVKDYVSDVLLFGGAVLSFFLAVRLSRRFIRQHRILSQKTFAPTEQMHIRKAYPADIRLIHSLAHKIWPATYSSILSIEQSNYMMEKMYSEEALQRDMEDGKEYILIYDGVEVVGFASYGWIAPGINKLHRIYFLPQVQGKGFGKQTIERIGAAVVKAGGNSLQLNVNRHNPAKGFYEKIGFTVIREEDIDIGNGFFMNDYVMEKRLIE